MNGITGCKLGSGSNAASIRAVCPLHGDVDAVVWKDALVCPDDACHRTCAVRPQTPGGSAACTCDPGLPEGVTNAQCPEHGIIAFLSGAQEEAPDPIVVLADALNQFAMRVEDFAYRWQISADARGVDKERERWGDLFRAARQIREEIAKVIPA